MCWTSLRTVMDMEISIPSGWGITNRSSISPSSSFLTAIAAAFIAAMGSGILPDMMTAGLCHHDGSLGELHARTVPRVNCEIGHLVVIEGGSRAHQFLLGVISAVRSIVWEYSYAPLHVFSESSSMALSHGMVRLGGNGVPLPRAVVHPHPWQWK